LDATPCGDEAAPGLGHLGAHPMHMVAPGRPGRQLRGAIRPAR
jgi:hypothetical protein